MGKKSKVAKHSNALRATKSNQTTTLGSAVWFVKTEPMLKHKIQNMNEGGCVEIYSASRKLGAKIEKKPKPKTPGAAVASG